MIKNQRTDIFLGLNNMLDPSSEEYREGMAYKSTNLRIDETGLWTRQQALTSIDGALSQIGSPHGSGSHYKNLAVDSVDKIVSMAVGVSCDVGPNKKLYSTNGSGAIKNAAGDVSDLTRPTITADTGSGSSTRAESGVYYYVCTIYNTTYDREGLPSVAVKSAEIDHDDGSKDRIVLESGTSASTTNRIRFYRSKRISSGGGVYNSPNIFFFVAEITTSNTYTDYLHDSEIANYEFEGRGTAPPSAIDYLISYNNRMLYFKGNVLYWSSAGRPEEVAQEYSVTIGDGATAKSVACKPKLSIGFYGEAKYEIGELAGQKVIAALPYRGKLYVWTSSMMGYIEATSRLEGYRFYVLHKGIGVTSDKVLALSPHGLFGADQQGIWLFAGTGVPRRLTDYRVDIEDSSKDTYLSRTNRRNSFGCWVPALNEYWWGVSGKIIAYQAQRNIFVGPYNYSVAGGTGIKGMQVYLSGGKTPSRTSKNSVAGTLQFWFGQGTPGINKDQVEVEIIHNQDPDSNVVAKVYQNCIASTTDATDSGNITYSTPVGKVKPEGSGKFFMLQLILPSSGAPVAAINYSFNPINVT